MKINSLVIKISNKISYVRLLQLVFIRFQPPLQKMSRSIKLRTGTIIYTR